MQCIGEASGGVYMGVGDGYGFNWLIILHRDLMQCLKTLYSLSDFFNQSLHYGILHLGTLIYNNIKIVECSVSSILKADMQKIPISSTGRK